MRSLLAGLPMDSRVVEIENPHAASYSLTNELLAALIEVVDASSIRTAAVTTPRKWKAPKPIEVPRPWLSARRPGAPKVRRRPTADETRRLLNQGVRGGG